MNSSMAPVTDFAQFAQLRAGAARNDPAVLREVAGQFEALFMQTILKNMRAGQLAEPLFSSDQHDMYAEMMDQQLAVEMARGKGLGLADMLVAQLGGGAVAASSVPAIPQPPAGVPAATGNPRLQGFAAASARPASPDRTPPDWSTPAKFAADVWPHARRIAKTLNVAPEALLAQAALETGWGKHVMSYSDGSSSHNLFGIKAGSDWFGGSVVRKTIEFVDGIAQQVSARFRAYPNVQATFDDYGAFIADSPRYAGVRNAGEDTGRFAAALQSAGYATDPNYAEKIRRIVGSDTFRDAVRSLKILPTVPTPESGTINAAR